MAGVRFENVGKIYYDKEKKTEVAAVRNFDLAIQDKEFVVFVGPSGCGKTTSLRMIAGLEEITSGKLYIGEQIVNDVLPKDRDIAMVFQNYALYPHLTVRENMGFSLKLRGIPKAEIAQKVLHVAGILRLNDYLDRLPKQLSGGQCQRVAIGRAIIREPRVFLFDEPLSNLDAKMRVDMRVELAKLHKQLNATIVYVTHDQIEAMTLADRIVVMNNGSIQQVGTPLDLYNHPTNAFVGRFIGSPAMNQMKAQVVVEANVVYLVAKDVKIPMNGQKANILRQHANETVLFGIRPHDLIPSREPGNRFALMRLLDVIEPIGNESFAYFSINGEEEKMWVAHCEGASPVAEGEQAAIVVNLENIHVFSLDETLLA